MVFGNLGDNSGTGVAFTRDPATGRPGSYGDYLEKAQGEDVVAGIRNTLSLADLARIDPASHDELLRIMHVLEAHYKDLCDIEFTIERGKLWMLQTRVGKRTAAAAFRIAVQLVDEGVIDLDTALTRVTGQQLAKLMFPQFDPKAARTLLATGMAASPGAAVGKAAFDVRRRRSSGRPRGEDVILVRRETNPDDLGGMVAARGILTSRGGKTSHAAVVARGMGRTCVVGVEALRVDPKHHEVTTTGRPALRRGRRHLHRRDAPARSSSARSRCRPAPSRRCLRGEALDGRIDADERELLDAVRRAHGRTRTRGAGWACGPTPTPRTTPARARGFGASGHRPVPDRAHVPRVAARRSSSG